MPDHERTDQGGAQRGAPPSSSRRPLSKDPWRRQLEALGEFIRTQRRLSDLSLRDLASMTQVSNPYLSQIERGLHEPSVRVLKSIAKALNVSAETILAQAGLLEDHPKEATETEEGLGTEAAIRADTRLTAEQKKALLGVYRSYIESND